jgi:hypothetical protein
MSGSNLWSSRSISCSKTAEGFSSVYSKIPLFSSLRIRERPFFLRFSKMRLGSFYYCLADLRARTYMYTQLLCGSRGARTFLIRQLEEPDFLLIRAECVCSLNGRFSQANVYAFIFIFNKNSIWLTVCHEAYCIITVYELRVLGAYCSRSRT